MDIALVSELLRNLIQGCETEGVEKESVPKWKAMLSKMPLSGQQGRRFKGDGVRPGMRILRPPPFLPSLPLYYGVAPEFENNPGLMDAAKKV